MKTRQSRRQTAKVSRSRWLTYAAASAATALAGSHSAEAAIHYSGPFHLAFPPHGTKTIQLDQPGDSIVFTHSSITSFLFGAAYFQILGIASAGFRGSSSFVPFVSRLSFGQYISAGGFVSFSTSSYFYQGQMAFGTHGQFSARGIGYVGFRFNNGAGTQYGWARVRMGGSERKNCLILLGYAYGDPGEPVRAGQRWPNDQSPDQESPDQGSLGGLALGAIGLLAWRKSRSRAAR